MGLRHPERALRRDPRLRRVLSRPRRRVLRRRRTRRASGRRVLRRLGDLQGGRTIQGRPGHARMVTASKSPSRRDARSYGAAMDIALLLFPDVNALDAVGPYEVLRHLPDANIRFVAPEPGPQRTEDGALALVADQSFDDVTASDVLVVPGGRGEVAIRDNERALEWVRAIDAGSAWTTSVCTGSLILAKAGLLTGKRATSHWTALEELRALGADPTEERVVVHGKGVTAAGVSSGIDMALWLAAQLTSEEHAKAIQLAIEYDPQPPFDSGSTGKAHPDLVDRMFRASRFFAA